MPDINLFDDARPWGKELWFKGKSPSMVKILEINPECKLSLQYHNKRDEFWYVLEGSGQALKNDEIIQLNKGSTVYIKSGEKHRIISESDGLKILELAFGEFDEGDITRIEDDYGRA